MGRTKRKRLKKKLTEPTNKNLDYEPSTINLKKWLANHDWHNNTNLKLKYFNLTGRGVTSTKSMKENDVLITIPYDLMITYTTILNTRLLKMLSPPIKRNRTMHDLLTLFLAKEKHKGEKSLWKHYINSLPIQPPNVPWLCILEELELFPKELKAASEKALQSFKESKERLKKSIDPKWNCSECKTRVLEHCVLEENLFTWAYVLVNTRAVYVDPQLICKISKNSQQEILIDTPCMALCPYLDMFNHNYTAKTEAELKLQDEIWVYQLRTLTGYQKYEQIFISYGAHNNVKLLVEYGFFIPGNKLDCVKFHFEEVIKCLKIVLNDRQYKFIKDHNFDKNDDLFIGAEGLSFNLKALLFVSFNSELRNFDKVIFGDCYGENFQSTCDNYLQQLLQNKFKTVEEELKTFETCKEKRSVQGLVVQDFLKYRVVFIKELLNKFEIESKNAK